MKLDKIQVAAMVVIALFLLVGVYGALAGLGVVPAVPGSAIANAKA